MAQFLRDLSPQRAHDATRAVALLPSPFETLRPLRTARIVSQSPEHAGQDLAIQESSSLLLAPRDAAHVTALSATPVPAARGDATAHGPTATPLQSRAPLLAQAAHESAHVRVAEPIARAMIMPSHAIHPTRASGGIDPEHPIRRETVAAPATVAVPAARLSLDAVRPVSALPLPSRLAASPLAQAPMSSGSLAARPTPRVDSRPVIHVTIDRIEVRPPTTPEPPKPSTRSRATAPSVSLNDYLRVHEPGRRGGIS